MMQLYHKVYCTCTKSFFITLHTNMMFVAVFNSILCIIWFWITCNDSLLLEATMSNLAATICWTSWLNVQVQMSSCMSVVPKPNFGVWSVSILVLTFFTCSWDHGALRIPSAGSSISGTRWYMNSFATLRSHWRENTSSQEANPETDLDVGTAGAPLLLKAEVTTMSLRFIDLFKVASNMFPCTSTVTTLLI